VLRALIGEIEASSVRVWDLVADKSLDPETQERRRGTTFTREMRNLDRQRRRVQALITELRAIIRADLGTQPLGPDSTAGFGEGI